MKTLLYPNVNNKLVTVGIDEDNNLINIDLFSLSISKSPMDIDDVNFNEYKYLEFRKSSELVYTVLYKVCKDSDIEDILGYVISDNYGNIRLVNLSNLCKIIESCPCMSYYLVTKNNKYFIRQYKGEIVCSIKDSDLKSIYGYSFNDLELRQTMSLEEIDFCMSNNGFKLGYAESFKVRETDCYYLLYFNFVGYLCLLRVYGDSLNYFNQLGMMMHHIDSKSYHNYIQKYPYHNLSSTPLGDLDSDIFVSSNQSFNRMMSVFNLAHTYSKPCIPYYFTFDLGGGIDSGFLLVTNTQYSFISDYADKISKLFKKNYTTILYFACDYVGYRNIFRYDSELQEFYTEYKEKFLEKYLEIGLNFHGFTVEQLNQMMKDLNEIV